QLRAEAPALAPAEVHAEQHLRPVLRLEAARAGVDLDDRVPRVVLAAEQLGELERGELALDLLDLPGELGERLGITLLGELQEDLRLVHALPLALEAGDGAEHRGGLAADGLRLLGVVPESGGGRLLAQLAGAALQTGEVKGASRARRPARP